MSTKLLPPGFEYVGGLTDAAHLQDYPEIRAGQLQLYSTSIEQWSRGGRHMGVVATKYTVPRPSLPDGVQARLITDGVGSTGLMHENVERVVDGWMAAESPVLPVLLALGLSAAREITPETERRAVVLPQTADVGNEYLRVLGIKDRAFAEYPGANYSAREGVEAAAEGVFLWANEYPHVVHDRTIHYPAVTLTSPGLLGEIKRIAATALAARSCNQAMEAIDLLTLPMIGHKNPNKVLAREDVWDGLFYSIGKYVSPRRIDGLAAEAIEWRDALVNHASRYLLIEGLKAQMRHTPMGR